MGFGAEYASMNSLILVIDTAHRTARVIIADGEKILGVKTWENTPKVGTDLLIYSEELLKEVGKITSDITRVGVHAGPGSFALLRTGIGTATILAQAASAELVEAQGETDEELAQSARAANPVASIEQKYNS